MQLLMLSVAVANWMLFKRQRNDFQPHEPPKKASSSIPSQFYFDKEGVRLYGKYIPGVSGMCPGDLIVSGCNSKCLLEVFGPLRFACPVRGWKK